MESFGKYYELLDQIRGSKNITIRQLCEGIISERTYLRQMKNGSNINLTVFNKLLDRLNVNLAQFMSYMIDFDIQNSGITQFILKVHHGNFTDIDERHQNLIHYQSENFIGNWIVKVYRYLYSFKSGKLSVDRFKVELKKCLKQVKHLDAENMIINHVKLIYHVCFPEDKIINPELFVDLLIGYNSTLSLLYYVLSLDIMLWFCSKSYNLSADKYEKLLQRFTYFVRFMKTKSFESTLSIYHATLAHLKEEFYQRDRLLAKGLLNASTIQSVEGYYLFREAVFTSFQIDPNDFKNNSVQLLKNHPRIEII